MQDHHLKTNGNSGTLIDEDRKQKYKYIKNLVWQSCFVLANNGNLKCEDGF